MRQRDIDALREGIQDLLRSDEHLLLAKETEAHLRAASNGLQYDADAAG